MLSLPDIPIDALPFPAAIVNRGGTIVRINFEWQAAHPACGPGTGFQGWCEAVHAERPELGAALLSAARAIVDGAPDRFVQDYGPEEDRCRISVTPCGSGALALHEKLRPAPDGAEDERRAQARKMETLGRLVGGVAHDFANLLTSIAGYCDFLLNRTGERDPLRPELDEIRKAANRGSRLTAQLLGFTRSQTAPPAALDLNALVTDVQRMLRPIIGEHVEVQTRLSANLGKVVADGGRMEQAIMNLVLNARDAMPAGGHIRIETFNRELDEEAAREHGMAQGPAVMLAIGDTGHGIDSAALERVFEPFFTTKEKGKGTGLGLSTVRSIVKQNGGDVWASSAPGAGATFTICLPRGQPSGEWREAAAAPRQVPAGSETVLVVEDEDGVRRLLTHVLHGRGYKVMEAASGEEALRLFEKRGAEIHLVLTDMVMPKMSGRELAEHLRRLRPATKVIYMSGYTADVLARTGALSPGMSFLRKPLHPEVLASKVREALDGVGASSAG
jgi:signal transduction histidine kinase/CheY-like chemotaxis protein